MTAKPGTWARLCGGLLSAAALALAVGALAPVTEAKGDSRIFPLDKAKKRIYGRTPPEWADEWNQWVLSLPVSVHPLFDESGALVEVGQRGPVWFLGGVFNESGQVVRSAAIPAGTALFFPLLNSEADNVGVDPPRSPEELRAAVDAGMSAIDTEALFLTVDGVEVRDLERGRVGAGPITFWMPEGNVFQYFGLTAPRGVYAPAAIDGYWVMLRPLSLGEHTIHFGFTGTFSLDITYNLTVVESNQP